MAFGIDLDRIQREAALQMKVYKAGQQAIIDMGGQLTPKEPEKVDPLKGKVDKNCEAGEHWDEGLQRCVKDEPADDRPPMPSSEGLTGTQHWVWLEIGKRWDIAGVAQGEKSPKPGTGDDEDDDDDPYLSYQKEKGIASAKAMMRGFLNQFKLGGAVNPDGSVDPDLTKWAIGMAETGLDGDAIVFEMRYGTDPTVRAAYRSVFPAMEARRENGYSAITEAEYINLTRGYTQIASAAGIDPDFLAGAGKTVAADGITALIAGDVSLAEWRDRVDLAEWSVTTVDPNVKGILQTTYGYTDQDLAMHFLDPARAASVKKAQQDVGGAKIISAGVTAIGDSFSRSFADYAYGQDIQGREVVAGLSPYGGLTGSTLYEEGMSPDEIAWGRFGSSEQRNRLRRGSARRTSSFQGAGGGLAATSAGIIGAGAVSN